MKIKIWILLIITIVVFCAMQCEIKMKEASAKESEEVSVESVAVEMNNRFYKVSSCNYISVGDV